jgi:mono/diheme cytochrome c family protein
VAESYKSIWNRWLRASESVIAYDGEIPAPTPEGIARGRELFMDAGKGNCQSCHGSGGRGDGDSAFVTDEDGHRMAKPDDWGNSIMPRNLRLGINRGGSRPIDIYRRIYAGINGTQMPALGESKDADGNPLLTPEELWDIVHYVRSLGERPRHVTAASSSEHSATSGSGH